MKGIFKYWIWTHVILFILTAIKLVKKRRGDGMLEGKEFDQKLGEYGEVSVDVNDKFQVQIDLTLKIDLVAEAKKLAAKTQTPIDDQAIAWLEKLQGIL